MSRQGDSDFEEVIRMLADEEEQSKANHEEPKNGPSGSIYKGCSSYRVFMHFVTRRGEEVEAKGVVSKACFELWKETRRNAGLKPEEVFRRALIAHVTGSDGRKPFDAKTEASILKVLKRKQTWPCFVDCTKPNGEQVKIGKRGFRSCGYHEGRRKRQRSAKAFHEKTPCYTASEREMMKEWQQTSQLLLVLLNQFRIEPEDVVDNDIEELSLQERNQIVAKQLIPRLQDWNPRSLNAQIAFAMIRSVRPAQFMSILGVTTILNLEWMEFSTLRMLLRKEYVSDPRIQDDFLFSPPLLPDLPIGRSIICLDTLCYVDNDPTSREIYHGNISDGGVMGQRQLSPVLFWLAFQKIAPRLRGHGEVLSQWRSPRTDQTVMVLRTHFKLHSDRVESYHQDVSHLYPDIMELPDDMIEGNS